MAVPEIVAKCGVACLTHAFNKNFWHVTLVAGDRDFRPLVVSLVQSGVHVHVCYEPASGSDALFGEADARVKMTVDFFHRLSKASIQATHPIPQVDRTSEHGQLEREGAWGHRAQRVALYSAGGTLMLFAHRPDKKDPMRLTLNSQETLIRYFEAMYGHIAWK